MNYLCKMIGHTEVLMHKNENGESYACTRCGFEHGYSTIIIHSKETIEKMKKDTGNCECICHIWNSKPGVGGSCICHHNFKPSAQRKFPYKNNIKYKFIIASVTMILYSIYLGIPFKNAHNFSITFCILIVYFIGICWGKLIEKMKKASGNCECICHPWNEINISGPCTCECYR